MSSYSEDLPETFGNMWIHQKHLSNTQPDNLNSSFFSCRLIMMSALGIVLIVLALSGPSVAFVPIGGGASTHVSITGTALMQKVTETCRAVVEASGHEFKPTVGRKLRMCEHIKYRNLENNTVYECWTNVQLLFYQTTLLKE